MTSNSPDDTPRLKIGTDYVANQVIVKFKEGIETSGISSLQESCNATCLKTADNTGFELWQLNGMSVEEAIATYSNDSRIAYIEPNYRISVEGTPDDPGYDSLWGLNNTGQTGGTPDADIDAPEAWDIETGTDVLIGVIDTGIDYTHPDLVDNIWTNPGEIAGDGVDNDNNGYVDDVHGYDFFNNDGDPFDDNGHGTHVAGTIAADGDNSIGVTGVNWSAQLVGIKFLGAGGYGDTFGAIQAVEYATTIGVQITNNSWGGGGYSQALYDAIAAAGDAGQLFIAAAGNDYGNNNDSYPSYPATYDLDNVISVAATNHNDQLAYFSNYGPTTVDLGAPGDSVYSTLPGNSYGTYSGTSMATPHVTGVAALLWAQDPTRTADQVKNRLLASVDPLPALSGITVSGGRLNAFRALAEAGKGAIRGSKWNDKDADGVRDANEVGLANWTIYLDENQNGVFDSAVNTISSSGTPQAIPDLATTNFTLNVSGLSGTIQDLNLSLDISHTWDEDLDVFLISPSGTRIELFSDVGGGDDATNDNFTNTTLDDEATISITNGTAPFTGSFRPVSSLSAFAYEDPNGTWTLEITDDSKRDLGTLNNWSLNFTTASETFTLTDANGDYAFNGLNPETYTVAEVVKPGWEQTFPSSPGSHTVAVEADATLEDVDFGNRDATIGLIKGSKWEDKDGDSVRDAGEAGLQGWTIYLDQNQNGVLDEGEVSTVTDANGEYTFFDLQSDTYSVAEVQQPGWVQTVAPSAVELDAGEIVSGIDFANQPLPGEISGTKWNDVDGDGVRDEGEAELAGWTIYLDQNQNGVLDDGEVSTVTDENGNYEFTNLHYGNYTVAEVLQPGWQQTYPGSVGQVLLFDDYYNNTEYFLTALNNLGLTYQFFTDEYSFSSALASADTNTTVAIVDATANYHDFTSVINFVNAGGRSILQYWDLDGDPTLATAFDATVAEDMFTPEPVYDWRNSPLFTGLTSPINFTQGFWNDDGDRLNPTGDGIAVGGFTSAETPNQVALIIGNSGKTILNGFLLDNAVVSAEAIQLATNEIEFLAGKSGIPGSLKVNLAPGEIETGIDFGNQEIVPGEIQGSKWNDLNGDGVRNEGESGLANWTIFLDTDIDGVLDDGETFTTTDTNGSYTFTGLNPGTYTVAEVQQEGWLQIFPVAPGTYTVDVGNNQIVTGIDFGNQEILPGEIRGSKWNDLDGDRVWDEGETGLSGWTIYLDQNKNDQLDEGEVSVVTDANGNYAFTGLTPGNYTLAEVQQEGWVQTSPVGFGSNITQLTDNSIYDYSPQTSGNNAVWQAEEVYYDEYGDPYYDSELYFYNGTSIIQLTDNESYYYESSPDISGNNVVWSVYDGYSDDEIYLYDGTSITQLTNNSYGDYSPQVSGNNVVWHGYDYASGEYDAEIFFYNGSSVTQITDNSYDDYPSAISGNNVVWSSYDGYDNEIYLYDGSSVTQLTDNSFSDYGPQISGNNVVWYGYDYASGEYDAEIFFYNGSSVTQITDNSYDDYPSAISGNNVVWSSYDGYDNEVYLYDGSSVIQITDNDSSDYVPQISGNNVVWQGYDYASGEYDAEIYLYDGISITQVTDNSYDDYSPQISDSKLVWSAYDGYDTEIYVASLGAGAHNVQLANGQIVEGLNFGNQQLLPGEIRGSQWHDNNGDGVRDASETGLSGWTLFLDANDDGVLNTGEVSTTTDANGNYAFTNVYLGTYTVAEVLQEGWEPTYPDFGGVNNNQTVDIGNGQIIEGIDFGNRLSIQTINGTAGGNNLTGRTPGRDIINGFAGNDTLKGGGDNDTLYGGVGDDSLSGGNEDDALFGEDGKDKLYGDSGNDYLDGGNNQDQLYGGDGNDSLLGASDNDKLYGDLGDDSLNGGSGKDQLYGGDGNDTLLGESEADTFDGGNGNDLLDGGGEQDKLNGASGDDTLLGGTETDALDGGIGNDSLNGDSAQDTLKGGDGDDTLVGGTENDSLHGGNGVDILLGVDPNSELAGSGEIDRLQGDAGNDTFVLGDLIAAYYNDGKAPYAGVDDYGLIADFKSGQDLIQLHGSASDYVLGSSPFGGNKDTAIFLKTEEEDELIGLVKGVKVSQLNLGSSSFSYV